MSSSASPGSRPALAIPPRGVEVAAHFPRGSWLRVAFAMFAVGWGANQFAPMLIVYRSALGLSAGTLGAIFGVYALGLIPGLLIGGAMSDRRGRRALVVPFVALSPLATLLLVILRESTAGLGVARLLAGVCSGVVFSVASVWVQELSASAAPTPGVAARRAAIALSAGFGAGPLVAGLLAQWAPDPLWVPYLPHLLLGAAAFVVVLGARETLAVAETPPDGPAEQRPPLVRISRSARTPRFRRVVAPIAPWVFGSAALASVVLPQQVSSPHSRAVGFAALVTALTLGAGVLVQPLAQRLENRRALSAGRCGLLGAMLGSLVGILALALGSRAIVACAALPFGVGYGMCLVSGLRETERLAAAEERGATVAVYYALTYTGFAVPYVVSLLAGPLTHVEVLVLFALLALGVLARLARTATRPATRRSNGS